MLKFNDGGSNTSSGDKNSELSDVLQKQLQSISGDFSDRILCEEIMRGGKDPSNMSREQMLHEILNLMLTKQTR